ncbi:MAG: class I SAM-dependent RNA methyltransferase [Nocardiopsaceae bacterium]|nr:class I SAM-dependent RNA methyltransferase [Nocardiopsaceae bacterium]
MHDLSFRACVFARGGAPVRTPRQRYALAWDKSTPLRRDLLVSLHTGDTIEVSVADVASGGWCLARPGDGPVVFVRHALPGERVRARVTEVTARFARAEAVEILNPSPERTEAPCPSARPFGCGGCDWQHAALPAQRALKAKVVTQQLRRLAGIEAEVTVEPLPGDEEPGDEDEPAAALDDGASDNSNKRPPGLGWRTRMQYAVRPDGRAGLRAHRSHEVIDVGDCLIAHPSIADLGIGALSWPGAETVEAITSGDERAVIVGPVRPGSAESEGVTAVTAEAVLSRAGRRLSPVRGRPYLYPRAAGRRWRVSAGAFWQVHPAAADTLAEAVLAALEPKPGDAVLDLYCGAGLFAGAVAPLVGPDGAVIAIESDEAAVRDARHNLRDTPWARVHRGDVARLLRTGRTFSTATLAIADPPRAGLARSVIEDLTAGQARRFAYVSCDPATLARDLGLLLARGWSLAGLRAFDAFPMTHHVECVVILSR